MKQENVSHSMRTIARKSRRFEVEEFEALLSDLLRIVDHICEIMTQLEYDALRDGLDWKVLLESRAAIENLLEEIPGDHPALLCVASASGISDWQSALREALKSTSLETDPATPGDERKGYFFLCLVRARDWRRDLTPFLAFARLRSLLQHGLRRAFRAAPNNEREVQDAIETLLLGADAEYSREALRITHAGGTRIPDFAIEHLSTLIEVKLLGKSTPASKIFDEIGADTIAYSRHWEVTFFVLYDVGGSIRHEKPLRRDVERDGTEIIVVRH